MTRPQLEVADIFRRFGPAWRAANAGHLSLAQRRVMRAVELCRTAELGGHVEQCADCAHTRIAYNSCRNRHCPKCQWTAAQAWLEAREAELLPVPYYHVVFTLPAALGALAYQNKARVYGLLLKAAAETLTTIAADPKHLGARIGVIAVLHSWGQTLDHHPHVHCIVPAGGISLDGSRWIACRPGFFLPVRVLSRLFRRLFLDGLAEAHGRGEIELFGDLAGLAEPGAFRAHLAAQRRREWVVYAKAPFAGPQAGAGLPRPLHPPGRDRQQPAGGARGRRPGELPLEGLPERQRPHEAEGHVPARRRVHAPLPAPRAARRVPPHPPLRAVRQRPSGGHDRALPRASRTCRPPRPRATMTRRNGAARPRRCPPALVAAGRCGSSSASRARARAAATLPASPTTAGDDYASAPPVPDRSSSSPRRRRRLPTARAFERGQPIGCSRRTGPLVVPCSAASDRGLHGHLAFGAPLPVLRPPPSGRAGAPNPHRVGPSSAVPCNKIFEDALPAGAQGHRRRSGRLKNLIIQG